MKLLTWHDQKNINNTTKTKQVSIWFYKFGAMVTWTRTPVSLCTWFVFRNRIRRYTSIVYGVGRKVQFVPLDWAYMIINIHRRHCIRLMIASIWESVLVFARSAQIARFMGPTWGPPGSCRPHVGPCWPHKPWYQGVYYYARMSYFAFY